MDEQFYIGIKTVLEAAKSKVYHVANFAMVEAYWEIGKLIIEKQGGTEKAEYGTGLLKELLLESEDNLPPQSNEFLTAEST